MHKFASVAERAVRICTATAASIFLISGVVYLWLGHWPVTHLDYWALYEFALNHTWLETTLDKHADHLMFFPSFFWLADLRFFHGDQELLFFAGLLLLLLTVTLLLTSRGPAHEYVGAEGSASGRVRPFVKWAGGKTGLLPILRRFVPRHCHSLSARPGETLATELVVLKEQGACQTLVSPPKSGLGHLAAVFGRIISSSTEGTVK